MTQSTLDDQPRARWPSLRLDGLDMDILEYPHVPDGCFVWLKGSAVLSASICSGTFHTCAATRDLLQEAPPGADAIGLPPSAFAAARRYVIKTFAVGRSHWRN